MISRTAILPRAFRPFLLAVVFIVVMELAVAAFGTASNFNTDYFDLSLIKNDVLQKHNLYSKYELVLKDTLTDIIQVGDSSGFFGVIPEKVTDASGRTYLNMNCCGDMGWEGHLHEAEQALKRTPTPKTLLLHVTPFWGPLASQFRGDNTLSVLFRDYIEQKMWWHKVRPPSAGYRMRITNLAYHGVWQDDFVYDSFNDYPQYPRIRAWRQQFLDARGWSPIPFAQPDAYLQGPATACAIEHAFSGPAYWGLAQDDALYRYLARFADVARSHGSRFVFVTNPIPCLMQDRALVEDVEQQLARFRKDYPDVVIPFEFFRTRAASNFADRWHLKPEGAVGHSSRIGAALKAAGL